MFTPRKPALFFISIILCCCAAAQPAKPKAAKPATKPAVAVKKIDYEKLKSEIRSLYRNEKHKEVIAKATQYLAKFPNDTAVTMQKAVSHVVLKQNAVGFGMVKKFFTNIDTAAKYTGIMAFSMPQDQMLTTGFLCADEAIKLSPAGPWGYFIKGGIHSDLQEHDKALPFMEEMNKRLRNDEEQKLLGSFYAKELAYAKQHDKAIAAIEALYKKFSGDEEITAVYSFVYRYNKNYDKAIEKYNELIKMVPDYINYHIWKASALDAWGKTTESCTETELIIAKDSTYDFLRYRYKCPAYFATPALADIKNATWAVDFNGSNYDFTVSNIKGNVTDGMEFNWKMTSGEDMNGHVTLTKEAMSKAIAQNNRFGPDMKSVVFTDKTTVWVSSAVINDLLTKGMAKMDAGYGEEEFELIPSNEEGRDTDAFEDKVDVKGQLKYLNTLHVKNGDATHQLWILNDTKNPLIVKMLFDWGITLKSIE